MADPITYQQMVDRYINPATVSYHQVRPYDNLDSIPLSITPTITEAPISAPPEANKNTFYVYYSPRDNYYYTVRGNKHNTKRLYKDLNSLYKMTAKHIMDLSPSNGVIPSEPYAISPAINSQEYLALQAKYRNELQGREVPDTDYTLRIKYCSEQQGFNLFMPAASPDLVYTELHPTLETAVKSAVRHLARYNHLYPENDWAVRPHKSSKSFKRLQQLQDRMHRRIDDEVPAYFNGSLFCNIQRKLKIVLEEYEGRESAEASDDLVIMLRQAFECTTEKAHSIAKSILQRRTGVEFVTCWDRRGLFHPSAVRRAYVDQRAEPGRIENISAWLCDEEFRLCNVCNTYTGRNNISCPSSSDDENETPRLYCSQCLEEAGFFYCDHCDEHHLRADGCPERLSVPDDYIYDYQQDVRGVIPEMFNMPEDKRINGEYLRYGVELEVLPRIPEIPMPSSVIHAMRREATALAGQSTKGVAILKRDSSLSDGGFEIVTAPATLDFHRKKLWESFFKVAAPKLKSWHTRCCGLHVHITRAALDKMQLSKLLVFYHEEVNGSFLSKIAGREVGPNARYCKTAKKKLGARRTEGDFRTEMVNQTPEQSTDHHGAITISRRNRGKTAEVRIFRGNVTRHGVMRALEFVDATALWCNYNSPATINIKDKNTGETIRSYNGLSYHAFLAWFDKPDIRSMYPDLWKHLIQLGFLRTKHTSKGKAVLDMIPDSEQAA